MYRNSNQNNQSRNFNHNSNFNRNFSQNSNFNRNFNQNPNFNKNPNPGQNFGDICYSYNTLGHTSRNRVIQINMNQQLPPQQQQELNQQENSNALSGTGAQRRA